MRTRPRIDKLILRRTAKVYADQDLCLASHYYKEVLLIHSKTKELFELDSLVNQLFTLC